MPIYRQVNKDFFKKWSYDMAYVLGFLFADGNIINTKRNTWFWSLQITDKDILLKIKKKINSSHKISLKKKIKNNKQTYRLQIGSKEMCSDLMNLGLTQRKSITMLLPNIPDKYFSDFLRGYFDGDGGVWFGLKNKKHIHKVYVINVAFTSGSRIFLESLRDILLKKGIIGGSLVQKERGFDLKYGIKNTLILYELMYNSLIRGDSLFLERKKVVFEKYIKMRS